MILIHKIELTAQIAFQYIFKYLVLSHLNPKRQVISSVKSSLEVKKYVNFILTFSLAEQSFRPLMKSSILIPLILLLNLKSTALAAIGSDYDYNSMMAVYHGDAVTAQVVPKDEGLAGEVYDVNSGEITFRHVDVSLPGNTHLPVEFSRVFLSRIGTPPQAQRSACCT